MPSGLTLIINGAERTFADLETGDSALQVVHALGFRQDRVALERNGEILPRAQWPETQILDQDRLEVVHFVGGGRTDRDGARSR